MLLELRIVQLVISFLRSCWALIVVKASNSMCNISNLKIPGESFSFFSKILRGIASLQVMIAGSGKRPSIDTLGGIAEVSGSNVELLRKRLAFSEPFAGGAN